jgi:RND family efflux transporter MFP subunit
MADIFISYSSQDRERVAPLAKALEGNGWDLFWDRNIPPGKTWDEVIEEAIGDARCIIVVWTAASVNSGWVRAEAEEGLGRNILVPVMFEDVKIPLRFRPVQAANLIAWEGDTSDAGYKQLQQALMDILGNPPDMPEEHKPKPKEQRARKGFVEGSEIKTGAMPLSEEPPAISQKTISKKRLALGVSAIFLMVVLSIIAVLYYNYNFSSKTNIPLVETIKMDEKIEHVELQIPSRLKAVEELNLSFRVTGKLTALLIKIGEEVKKGQILAKIDANEFELKINNIARKLEESKAALRLAQNNYERFEQIQKKAPGTVSQADINRARDALEKRQNSFKKLISEREAALKQLGYTNIRAPFDGLISNLFADNFQTVKPDQPIIAIQNISRFKLVVDIHDDLISSVKKSNNIRVHTSAFPKNDLNAVIKNVSSKPSETSRTYSVLLVSEPNPGLKILPGMSATVKIKISVPGKKISSAAVSTSQDKSKSYVWLINQKHHTVSEQEVTAHQLDDSSVLITDGLQPGELIVANKVNLLQEGQKVKYAPLSQ